MITEPRSPRSDNEPPGRRRLVIDLNPPGHARVSRRQLGRGWPRSLVILGTVIVLVAALAAGGAYFWWQLYKTKPAYSLALLVDACQRNDMAVVDQIVDTDRIVDSLAAQITGKTGARYGASLNPSMRKRVEALVPALMPRVKENARPVLAKRVQEIFERSEPKPFVVLAIGLPYLVNITSEGDAARVTAPMPDRQVELTLRRNGDRWKVVEIKDNAVVERIVDNIIREFPAIGQVR